MGFYSEMARYYDTIFPFRPRVGRFLAHQLTMPGRVLDLGCGTGEYCAHLHQGTRTCLGLDLDPEMINEATRRHPAPEFQVRGLEDLADLPGGAFAGAFCIGNVLAHLPCTALPSFLVQLKRLLVPGAAWIVQLVNFDPLQGCGEHIFPVREFPQEGLAFHRRYLRATDGEYHFHTRLTRNGQEIFSGSTPIHLHPTELLLEVHRQAGFEPDRHLGDFDDTPFAPERSAASVFIWRARES